MVRALDEAGILVESLDLVEPTLDDVFVAKTGDHLEGDEEQAAEPRPASSRCSSRLAVNLRVIGALGRRSVRQTFRRPQLFAPIIVFPTLLLAIQTGGAGGAVELEGFPQVNGFLDFMLAGAMIQSCLLAGNSGGIALAVDLEMGFTDRLFAAPISRFAIVLGRLAGTAALGAVTAVWFIAIGLDLRRHDRGAASLGAMLMLVLVALSAIAFGGIGAAIALRTGQRLGGAGPVPARLRDPLPLRRLLPGDLMLEPAATIAEYNPLTLHRRRDPRAGDRRTDRDRRRRGAGARSR